MSVTFSEQTGVFFGGDSEFVVVGVMPDLSHILPVSDDTMRDWVLQHQHALLGLCLIAHVGLLLIHAHHNRWHFGLAHYR